MNKSSISIVLVRPIHPGNIGSVSRAMKNSGLKNLILVNPCDFKNEETKKMAVGDLSILNKAKVFDNLKDALTSFDWVVGTTRRNRRRFNRLITPKEVAEKLNSLPKGFKTALVFGPEDKGLGNADLALCQNLSTIPSHPDFPSLNLAQAVMIYGYEIFSSAFKKSEVQSERFSGIKELEAMYDHFEKMLNCIGYFNRGKPETLMESIRNFLGRAALSSRDVRILRGICATVIRKIKQG